MKLPIEKSKLKNVVKLPSTAPDKIASVVVLEIEGPAEVLPLPASGKPAKASSVLEGTSVSNLFDMNPKNKWRPKGEDKERSVEVDLKEEMTISAFSLAEPWYPMENKGQKISLQYKKGEKWENISEFTTNGSGYTAKINPVTARYFKLTILEAKEPTLTEWILFRAE